MQIILTQSSFFIITFVENFLFSFKEDHVTEKCIRLFAKDYQFSVSDILFVCFMIEVNSIWPYAKL